MLARGELPGIIARMLAGAIDPAPGGPRVDARPLLAATAPQELAKLRCLLAYFDRIADDPPRGSFTIERVVVAPHDWFADASPLGPFEVRREGAIEDAADCRQVDFANAFLGGGVLSGGCVQEEIRFAVAPELLAGMIVSPRLGPLEAIVLRGAERFAVTKGYAFSLRYAGRFDDPCARAADGTPDVELVAIDAIDYRRAGSGALPGGGNPPRARQGARWFPPRRARARDRHGQLGLWRVRRRSGAEGDHPVARRLGGGARDPLLHLRRGLPDPQD